MLLWLVFLANQNFCQMKERKLIEYAITQCFFFKKNIKMTIAPERRIKCCSVTSVTVDITASVWDSNKYLWVS